MPSQCGFNSYTLGTEQSLEFCYIFCMTNGVLTPLQKKEGVLTFCKCIGFTCLIWLDMSWLFVVVDIYAADFYGTINVSKQTIKVYLANLLCIYTLPILRSFYSCELRIADLSTECSARGLT